MKQKDLDFDDIIVDPEGIVEDINITEIEDVAKIAAFAMCKNLREVFFDEDFMSRNPRLRERLEVELESLRVLIKMRKSDEIAHDLCLRSIGLNTNNASLYKSLTSIQSSLLSIQKQMDETVKNINSLLKNVQLELNFDNQETNTQQNTEISTDATRGSKKFIEQMKKELEKDTESQKDIEINPNELFADESVDEENEEEQED